MDALRCAKKACWGFPYIFKLAAKQGLHNSNPCMPQQPLAHTRVSRASRRDSPPDQPCGLKITAVSIPSVLRPFQAQLWHQVSGTVSRAGMSLSEERGRVRGQLREPYQPYELFPWCWKVLSGPPAPFRPRVVGLGEEQALPPHDFCISGNAASITKI